VTAGRFKLGFGKQHRSQKMMQHGIAGPGNQSLFAQLAGCIRLAGIKGCGCAANDVLGGVLAHAGRLEHRGMIARKGAAQQTVIPGHRAAMNPESRDSGFALSRAPE
jgi:hypothetical protein